MYHEILRLLEADKDSVHSKASVHSSTTISSFTSSKDTNMKKSQHPRRFMSIQQSQNHNDHHQSKSFELK